MLFPVSLHEFACENRLVPTTTPPTTITTNPVPFSKSHQISSRWSG